MCKMGGGNKTIRGMTPDGGAAWDIVGQTGVGLGYEGRWQGGGWEEGWAAGGGS